MNRLRRPLETVCDSTSSYYGGNQAWCSSKLCQGYGCGIVAITQVLLHLENAHHFSAGASLHTSGRTEGSTGAGDASATKGGLSRPGDATLGSVTKEEFLRRFGEARKHFLLLPYLGMNGLFLSFGSRLLLRECGYQYHVHWGVWPSKIWDKTRKMLEEDIPVILSIGPNRWIFSKKHKVSLYTKNGETYRPATQTYGHYVTITAMDDDWLTISSWGRQYYINRKEYEHYAKHRSNWLFSNILYIMP